MTKQSSFSMPSTNLFGVGSIQETGKRLKDANATKALLVTDKGLFDLGLADRIADIVKEAGVEVEIFPKAEPNPTDENVAEGVEAYKAANCDALVSLGGGSSHDAAKGIGIVVSNGGTIHDYEGVDQSKNPMVPLVSINTTAGTASEMTKFTIITDKNVQLKWRSLINTLHHSYQLTTLN